jgi:serine/threonine-protein kinase RsbW
MGMETRTFPGNVDSLDPLRDYLGELAKQAGLSKKSTYSLKLAVDEIATNIILYGYESAKITGTFNLLSEITETGLVVILEDDAKPFNPLENKLPDELDLSVPLHEREIGGLGIFLTVSGVDDFSYDFSTGRNRNIFKMKRE